MTPARRGLRIVIHGDVVRSRVLSRPHPAGPSAPAVRCSLASSVSNASPGHVDSLSRWARPPVPAPTRAPYLERAPHGQLQTLDGYTTRSVRRFPSGSRPVQARRDAPRLGASWTCCGAGQVRGAATEESCPTLSTQKKLKYLGRAFRRNHTCLHLAARKPLLHTARRQTQIVRKRPLEHDGCR